MALSKKHYIEIAKIIDGTMQSVGANARATPQGSVMLLAEKLCLHFKAENPLFNKEVFRAACGYDVAEEANDCPSCRVGMRRVGQNHVSKSGVILSRCKNY